MKRNIIYPILLAALTVVQTTAAKSKQDEPQPIHPISIEVGYTKTVHILFPSPVTYIDIGSMDILAGKADGAENVVRVKAAVRNFAAETNLTVITEDGGFYTFDARYTENRRSKSRHPTARPETKLRPRAGCCCRKSDAKSPQR